MIIIWCFKALGCNSRGWSNVIKISNCIKNIIRKQYISFLFNWAFIALIKDQNTIILHCYQMNLTFSSVLPRKHRAPESRNVQIHTPRIRNCEIRMMKYLHFYFRYVKTLILWRDQNNLSWGNIQASFIPFFFYTGQFICNLTT